MSPNPLRILAISLAASAALFSLSWFFIAVGVWQQDSEGNSLAGLAYLVLLPPAFSFSAQFILTLIAALKQNKTVKVYRIFYLSLVIINGLTAAYWTLFLFSPGDSSWYLVGALTSFIGHCLLCCVLQQKRARLTEPVTKP